ncbi:MAG: hypothetical protein WAU21_00305 [Chitinophagales bacterium]
MKQKIILLIISIVCTFNFSLAQDPEIIWEHTYGGNDDDFVNKVLQTEDGGFLLGGYTYSIDGDILINQGLKDILLIKTDSIGNLEWSKTYGGSQSENVGDIVEGVDGGYVLAGSTNSEDGDVSSLHGNFDVWIIKIDTLGNIEWEKLMVVLLQKVLHQY